MRHFILFLILLFHATFAYTSVLIGFGQKDITPPIGTSSAGYETMEGRFMEGIHDPLLAGALFIQTEDQSIVLCSVDHLGFTTDMVMDVQKEVRSKTSQNKCEIFISSSHTHSGGGSFLNIPGLGEYLAGPFNQEIRDFYVKQTAAAIIQAMSNPIEGKIGIGYGRAPSMSFYRGKWPIEATPLQDIAIIKALDLNDKPIALLFNYAVHPTILKADNKLFSSDWVGQARKHIQNELDPELKVLYINGAQGDVLPKFETSENAYIACENYGKKLATFVTSIWNEIEVENELELTLQKKRYFLDSQSTPQGLQLLEKGYPTEVNLIVLNQKHAFLTVPGEMSCIYDRLMKEFGTSLGYDHVSIFGLTNDAHGYIITPDSWKHKTYESELSFGGEEYGKQIENYLKDLLENSAAKEKIAL